MIRYPNINISYNDECAFRHACYNKQLDIAKWLLNVNPDIHISVFNDAFQQSCRMGHLDVVEWLISVKPDIDISFNHDLVFRNACYDGYLDLAKLLIQMKPDIDISVYDNHLFKDACIEGYFNFKCLEVAKWLQSLKPYLYVIEYDKNGKYISYRIREKEEEIIPNLLVV